MEGRGGVMPEPRYYRSGEQGQGDGQAMLLHAPCPGTKRCMVVIRQAAAAGAEEPRVSSECWRSQEHEQDGGGCRTLG